LERRRRLAVDRVLSGYTQAEVAKFLGVHRNTVWRWFKRYRQQGKAGLRAKPQKGRPPKLNAQQEGEVLHWFSRSPTEFGFPTELWTARRVRMLIWKTFGVKFNTTYLNYWLAQRRITPQKPQRRPRERDEKAIRRWVTEEWPRKKKERPGNAPAWYGSMKVAR
jgi:transposase